MFTPSGISKSPTLTALLVASTLCMGTAGAASAQPAACPSEFKFAAQSGYAFHGVVTGTAIRSFGSSTEALGVVRKITDAVGLPAPPFSVCEADLPNAHAILTTEGRRYIAYSKPFMQNLNAATGGQYWSMISVMAHEVGHHLAFHNYDNTEAHKAELEADFFSGFIVGKLGAKLDEAEVAMRAMASPQDTPSHPGLDKRLDAIRTGWNRAATNGAPNTRPAPDRAADAGSGTVAGANSAAATVRIQKWADHYVEGDGYSKTKVASYGECETRCLADARCLTMEFYKPQKLCNLYATPGKPLASKDADIGMKSSTSTVASIAPVATGKKITRYENRYVEGDGYAKHQAKDYAACAAQCQADARCLLVEFFKPAQACNLFDQARNHFPSKEADVGIRQ